MSCSATRRRRCAGRDGRFVGSLLVGMGMLALVGCDAVPASFQCQVSAQCSIGQESGACVAGGCAFADARCPSGLRYHWSAGSEAGQCTAVAAGDLGVGDLAASDLGVSDLSSDAPADLSGGGAADLASGAVLMVTSLAVPAAVDLTAEGVSDWSHWGGGPSNDWVHKSLGKPLISNRVGLGTVTDSLGNGSIMFSWSDGTPLANESGWQMELQRVDANNGFSFAVSGSATVQTLTVYLDGSAQSLLRFHLSDGSVSDFVTKPQSSGQLVYQARFRGATAAASLTVSWICQNDGDSVLLAAATLQ